MGIRYSTRLRAYGQSPLQQKRWYPGSNIISQLHKQNNIEMARSLVFFWKLCCVTYDTIQWSSKCKLSEYGARVVNNVDASDIALSIHCHWSLTDKERRLSARARCLRTGLWTIFSMCYLLSIDYIKKRPVHWSCILQSTASNVTFFVAF